MSINTEKDDQATQEMMAMLGLPDEDTSASEVDDLLNAIDDLDAFDTETTAEVDNQIDDEPTYPERHKDEDIHEEDLDLDLDEIELDEDGLIPDSTSYQHPNKQQVAQSETSMSLATETSSDELLDDLDDLLATEAADSHEDDAAPLTTQIEDVILQEDEPSPLPSSELTDESTIDLEELSSNAPLAEETDEFNITEDDANELSDAQVLDDNEEPFDAEADAEALSAVRAELPESLDDIPQDFEDAINDEESALDQELELVDIDNELSKEHTAHLNSNTTDSEQTASAIAEMQKAIEADQEIKNIAASLKETAQEATKIALETARQAQNAAQQTQRAINATFEATERALNAAKNAGYELDLTVLNTTISDAELDEQIKSIQAINLSILKENQAIKQRIDALQKS